VRRQLPRVLTDRSSGPAASRIQGIDAALHTDAFFSKRPRRESAWSTSLRIAKDPSATEGGWDSLHHVCDRGAADLRDRAKLLGRVDLVVTVPSRKCRLVQRGMSLPDEFGRALHDSLRLRYESDVLISTVDHIEIKHIAIEHRSQAVTGTFAVTTGNLVGKAVLLVDDICTSGATLAECAQLLRNAGVSAVIAYTLGRTADFRSPVSQPPAR
jgi:phosphoribosylpyrophosphate synthetase